ncbi:MAG: kelch repeat-containing protein [Pseudomonadota bacterium]
MTGNGRNAPDAPPGAVVYVAERLREIAERFGLGLLVLVLAAILLAGCGGNGGPEVPEEPAPPPPVADAPAIAAQPQSVDVVSGADAQFRVEATANGTLSFQWRFDGNDISGETAESLSLAAVAPEDAGVYECLVTNTLDGTTASTISEAATLNVIVAPEGATASGENAVLPGSTGNVVAVPAQSNVTYAWSISNGTITAGQGTNAIEYTAGELGKTLISATIGNEAGTVYAVKTVVVVASLPVVSVFSQPAVLSGSAAVTVSTPAADGNQYAWSLERQATEASVDGPTDEASLTYLAGVLVGEFELSVSVTDAQGRTAEASANVEVLEDAFVKDLRDPTSRSLHTATLLNDGRVLIVGGDVGIPVVPGANFPQVSPQSRVTSTVEMFDPTTETWALSQSLPSPRSQHTATLLRDGRVLVTGGAGADGTLLSSALLYEPAAQQWADAAPLAEARAFHTATLLSDGRVLAVGGVGPGGTTTATAEVYDPSSDSWTSAGSLFEDRGLHTAVLLPDGEVLVTMGRNTAGNGNLVTSERYNPGSNSWRTAAPVLQGWSAAGAVVLLTGKVYVASANEIYDPVADVWEDPFGIEAEPPNARFLFLLPDGQVFGAGSFFQQTASWVYDPIRVDWQERFRGSRFGADRGTVTLLQDGRALSLGGLENSSNFVVADNYTSIGRAQLLHPTGDDLSTLGSLAHEGADAATGVLPDARVLVTGGSNARGSGLLTATAAASLFDPDTDTWHVAGEMATRREQHTLTVLADGSALVLGGTDGRLTALQSAERYDPITDAWSSAGGTASTRFDHTATLLIDGRVLAVGGDELSMDCECTTFLGDVDLYDPNTNAWQSIQALGTPRFGHTATRLADGRVLVSGGYGGVPDTLADTGSALASAEIFDPASETWSDAEPMTTARVNHTAVMLSSGRVLIVGGEADGTTLLSVEIYDPGTDTWSSAASLSEARQQHAAALLRNGDVLVVGGFNNVSSALFGVETAERYDPTLDAWTSVGSFTTPRQGFILERLADGRVLLNGGLPNVVGLPEFYK